MKKALKEKCGENMCDCIIKKVERADMSEPLELVRRVFDEFEAPEYPQEGIREFYNALGDEKYLSELTMFCAFSGEKPVGVIAVRSGGAHIALFFVDKMYQRRGIGGRLFRTVLNNCTADELTVNSSPYAVEIYRRLGFEPTDGEQAVNGIRFTPMKRKVNKNKDRFTVKYNELTAEEFISLWESVWGAGPSPEQTELAMRHTLFRVSVYDGEKPIAMARMLGDMGLNYYIKDVAVRPEYQGAGLGKLLINELMDYIDRNGVDGTDIFVELCAVPDKKAFYEKFGFSANDAQRLKLMHHVNKGR